MPFNGVGLFTSLGVPTFPAVPNTYIVASYFNATMNDVFLGLSSVMTRDGQSPMTADLPMGGNKVANIADGVSPTDAVSFAQVFTSPTFASPTLTGTAIAPTPAPGTNNTQIATTEFVVTQAMNVELPLQPGNAGKFLKTNGTVAAWESPSVAGADLYLYSNFGGF